jgi:hypothetical protein
MWTKEMACEALDTIGHVCDIGQLSAQAKRYLNYLAIHGCICKSTTYQYPVPKTIWRHWTELDILDT